MGYVSQCPHSQTHAWGLDSEPRSLVPGLCPSLHQLLPCINPSSSVSTPAPAHFTSDQREAAVLICQKLCQICQNQTTVVASLS